MLEFIFIILGCNMGFIKFNFSVNVGRMLINMMIDEVLVFI